MNIPFTSVLLLFLNFREGSFNEGNEITTIDKVFVLFRHGTRLEINKEEFEKVDLVPLTNEGKLEAYNLGQMLRHWYPGLLHHEYKAEEIYARSSDVDRCLMTTLGVLAGLYHPIHPSDKWTVESDLQWNPIPVHTIPKHMDDMLYSGRSPNCTEMNSLIKSIVNEWRNKYPALLNYYESITKSEIDTRNEISNLLLEFDETNIPSTITHDQVMTFIKEGTETYFGNDKLKSYVTGAFLKDILKKINTNKKMMLYCTHDSFFSVIFYSLGLTKPEHINFLSTLIFELHSTPQQQKYIKVIFKNGPDAPLEIKSLPHCDDLCPFDKFQTLVEPVVSGNWFKDCEVEISE